MTEDDIEFDWYCVLVSPDFILFLNQMNTSIRRGQPDHILGGGKMFLRGGVCNSFSTIFH